MNKKFLLLLIIVAAVVVLTVAITKRGTALPPQTSPSPSPYTLQTVNSWKDVIPGNTTVPDITRLLGPPVKKSTRDGTEVYEYQTQNKNWTHEVLVKNNKAVFINERVFPPDNVSLKKHMEPLGRPPTRLYGPDFESGIFVFVFPELGIAFKAQELNDYIYEIWHFPPTSLAGFLTLTQTKEYGTTPIPEPEAF